MSHPMENHLAEARAKLSERERNRYEVSIKVVADANCPDCKGKGSYRRGKLCGCISTRRIPVECQHPMLGKKNSAPNVCLDCGKVVE